MAEMTFDNASENRSDDDIMLVAEALNEYRSSLHAVEQLDLLKMGPGLKSLIWGLRIYVLFMVGVVVINTIQTLH
ncbi:MAG: hypothetical protein C7B45_02895 [Sulfobacillus acidophilus]|uniref:Uncharacterized protein n=1 Tax=Sulfobacillus acidophilus TaxID=53633 RepID=A0A2T2WMN8_9FIRM|nr:MAG: hypothetical protein C7B45_02895 [Sulfobacillus acidophilus]